MLPTSQIPANASEITPEWMQQALTAGGNANLPGIRDVALRNIGAGVGMMGEILRCQLSYDSEAIGAPDSVVVKLPSPQAKIQRLSRRLSLYKREYDFYRYVASNSPIRSPRLLYGDFEAGSHRFVLVLEDLQGMTVIDHEDGASPELSKRTVRAMARIHGQFWNKVNRAPLSGLHDSMRRRNRVLLQLVYLHYLIPTLKNFGGLFSKDMRRLAEMYGPRVTAHGADLAAGPRTFIHGDLRLDNIFFGDGEDIALVDWQVSGLGSGLYDVAYFLGASVSSGVRREIEREALGEYHDIVSSMGARDFTFDLCWRLYRSNTLARLLISVLVCGGLDLSDERVRKAAEISLQRSLTAIEELEAGEFLPVRRPLFSFANAFSIMCRGGYHVFKALR